MKTNSVKLNWPLLGNRHIFEFLAKSIANKNIFGSYIFTGPANIGKTTAAYFFAKSLVCMSVDQSNLPCGKCPACALAEKGIHGDIYLIKKIAESKNISVDQIRGFIRNLGLSSFLNSYKIGIVKGAENLSDSAVNALLKTLEEPRSKVIIILTATDFEALPKTIISRSQILRFRPVSSNMIYDDLIKNHQVQRSQAKNFSRLCAGRPALALKFLEDKDYYENYKVSVRLFIEFLSQDANQRLSVIKDIFSENNLFWEAAKSASRIIDIWQTLVRDLMLLDLGLTDLVQHQAFIEEIAILRNKFTLKSLINLLGNLQQTKEYIRVNVNPKMAFENLAVSI